MWAQEQQQKHVQSSYEHHANHPQSTYRCYIRTPDMRCKVENVSTDQSVSELKDQIRTVLHLGSEKEQSAIKLVVNETQLTDQTSLTNYLFQNAIIHVLVSTPKNTENNKDKKISLRIKQPPISSQIQTISDWPAQLSISELKSTIIQFYQQKYPSNPIATLSSNDLYLVYGGRILIDSNTILDYDIQENGVIYVVNGKIYAKEVTKQEAERRIQEVKKGQYNEAKVVQNIEGTQTNQFPQENSAINQSQDVVFNIIENIVHDEDSDVEGQTAGDLTRSQRIIRRYDSINRPLISKQDDCVVTEGQNEDEVEDFLSKNVQNQKQADRIATQHTPDPEQQQAVHQYVNSVSQKIVNIEEDSAVQEESSQNNVDQVSRSFQDHPDSVPQKDGNQDEDLLL